MRFGYAKIPVRVIQHNFDYLFIKAKAEETANNQQIHSTRVAIQFEEQGWLTFQFEEAASAEQLSDQK